MAKKSMILKQQKEQKFSGREAQSIRPIIPRIRPASECSILGRRLLTDASSSREKKRFQNPVASSR